MIYLIKTYDDPNNAAQNRFLSFIKGLNELGLDFQIVFMKPNLLLERTSLPYSIKVSYLWKKVTFKNRTVLYLFYILWSKLLSNYSCNSFCRKLKEGDKIVVFDGINYIHKFVNCKGVKVYAERTEHPEIVGRFKSDALQREYFNDCRRLEGIFVISNSLKRYFESIGVESSKIHIINMTVDPSRFFNIIKKNNGDKYFAYCGTILNNKDGVNYLLESFSLVVKRYSNVKLYVIGKIPLENDRESNYRLIRKLGINDNVILTGLVSAHKMPQLLVDSTAVVLARPDSIQAKYGFPTKLGEYLMSKNPVIVTDVGDISLFLRDKESALICEERNIYQFADKMCWVLNNPDEAKKIGLKGYNVALENFNSMVESRKIFDIIK